MSTFTTAQVQNEVLSGNASLIPLRKFAQAQHLPKEAGDYNWSLLDVELFIESRKYKKARVMQAFNTYLYENKLLPVLGTRVELPNKPVSTHNEQVLTNLEVEGAKGCVTFIRNFLHL